MKNEDLMSAEAWGKKWQARTMTVQSKVKSSLRRWALRDRERMLEMLFSQVETKKEEISAMELGCAPGSMLYEMHRACPKCKLYGLDYSEKGLEMASWFLKEQGIEAKLFCGDVRTFVPEKKHDIVMSFGLIEHFSDPAEILSAHKNFVAKGGIVAITVPNFSHELVQWTLSKYRPETLETHNLNIMSEKKLSELFRQCGFVDVCSGGAVGPLLPTPESASTLGAKIYKGISVVWNGSIRILPPKLTWYGAYWAFGRLL